MPQKLRTGIAAPDFSLTDTNGKNVTLSAYREKKVVVLVFNRGFM